MADPPCSRRRSARRRVAPATADRLSSGRDRSTTTSVRAAVSCARRARATPSRFDGVAGFAEPGGVNERDRQALDVHALGQQVPRRPGNLGHDRARRADERVEQTRFAGVRPAGDHDQPALANHPAGAALEAERRQLVVDPRRAPRGARRRVMK